LRLYRQRQWNDAAASFRAALELDPTDGPSKTLLERCVRAAQDPPPEPWDGVYAMATK